MLTQDANQRPNQKWLFTKYDQLNRPIMTGFYTNSTQTSLTAMQGYLNTQNLARFETYTPGTVERYTFTNSFPVNTLANVLSMNFYDDYSWSGWHGPDWNNKDNSFDNYLLTASTTLFPYAEPVIQSVNTRGLVTGVWQPNSAPGLLVSYVYDNKERVIQTKNFNITEGRDITTTQYSFSGQPLVIVNHLDKKAPIRKHIPSLPN
ncbi:hypothetical protein [Paraflavitalea speifideaquila]|uniref:hypothetical protein n=1 Tax=Paraflavitalea speifideaquila TaxID=3076558 RepID=UPI0028E77766|nr:hypothetical protein [Paraflavitalea speifideiaquila]